MDKELIAKAKQAKTPEELYEMAKEVGREMTEESAKEYFAMLHPKTGELGDDELDDVSGGGCGTPKDDRMVVTPKTSCYHFSCKYDEWPRGTDMSKISSGILDYYCVKCYKSAGKNLTTFRPSSSACSISLVVGQPGNIGMSSSRQ